MLPWFYDDDDDHDDDQGWNFLWALKVFFLMAKAHDDHDAVVDDFLNANDSNMRPVWLETRTDSALASCGLSVVSVVVGRFRSRKSLSLSCASNWANSRRSGTRVGPRSSASWRTPKILASATSTVPSGRIITGKTSSSL